MNEIIKPQFAFEKKLGIPDCAYGDIPLIIRAISLLLLCMKDTNKLHEKSCEFFRLDFRQQHFDESLLEKFPIGSLILDLKWGSKEELEKLRND